MACNAVLGSSMYLVAVTGLLLSPPVALRRSPAVVAGGSPRHTCATLHAADNSFDAGAWKRISAAGTDTIGSEQPGATTTPRSEEEDGVVIDVDVEKLPTFAIFSGAGGRRRRDDIVGGSDARICRARLQEALSSLPRETHAAATPASSRPSSDKGGPFWDCGDPVGGVDGRGGRVVFRQDPINAGGANSIGAEETENENVVDVTSRDALRRMVSSRREDQGPVVVMYHAPWCRKCTYLTPMFRRLARRMADEPAGDGDGQGDSARTDGLLFCRIDVSRWGRGVASATAAAAATVAAKGTDEAVAATWKKQGREVDAGVDTAVTTMTADGDVAVGEPAWLHEGSPAVANCEVCLSSGFVPCGQCEGKGAVIRSSPDGKYNLAVTCPACVGYKRLRCPSCGGKCYMCE